jgi:eukaryotic-like serine/threonine-protein kinase
MSVQHLTGQTLGQYELRGLLGKGGMGAVYSAYQASLKREVAIKVLPPELLIEPTYQERFIREAQIAASLEHPNIVSIYDYGTQNDISYVVMRLLTGGSLSDWLQNTKPTLEMIADLLAQLAGALDYAHNRGVFHRDVKPTNVMFDNLERPYLVDFGLAKLASSTTLLTASGVVMGTPAYMPPEQWLNQELTPAADQYALGVVAYQMITGSLPFKADVPYAMLHKHLNEPPPPPQLINPELPDSLTPVFWRVLAKDPADRFSTVTAFVDAFVRALNDTAFATPLAVLAPQSPEMTPRLNTLKEESTPPLTRPPVPTEPLSAQPKRQKRSWLWLLTLTALVALVGLVFIVLQPRQDSIGALPTRAILPTSVITEMPLFTATMSILERSTLASSPLIYAAVASITPTPIPSRTLAFTPTNVPSRTPLPTATLSALDYYNLAAEYANAGDYEQAMIYYSIGVEIDPYFADAYLARAWLYFNPFANYEQSAADFTNVLSLNPESAEAYYGRGLMYSFLGSYDAAISDLSNAIDLNPSSAESYYLRGTIYAVLGSYDQAIVDLTSALNLNPSYLEAYVERGKSSSTLGDYASAVSDFTSATGIDPDNTDLYMMRGDNYAALGDYASAVADFTYATQLNYDLTYAFLRLGDLYYDQGSGAESLANYQRYVELAGDSAETYAWERIAELGG